MTTRESALSTRGFEVLRGAVPRSAIERTLRHLHLDLVRHGADPETIGRWLWGAHWFPHLKWDEEVLSLLEHVPEELREGELCDPQILLQPPDDTESAELVSHVDTPPDWANGRGYARILGIALSPAHSTNGGLVVWPFDRDGAEPLDLQPGDVVVMHPDLPHASGLNREGAIRYAVYYRFLESA